MEVAMVVSSNAHSQKPIPHKKNNRFYNLEHEKSRGVFFHSFFMFMKSYLKRRFFAQKNRFVVPDSEKKIEVSSGDIEITWIGHSTFLIKLGTISLITDPIFGDASFLFRRIAPPGIPLKEIGAIDYVLLSHNHRDHMDATSLLHMRAHQPQILVPKGDKKWFQKRAFKNVHEAEWWQEISCSSKSDLIRFYFLPAYHWSQRSLLDRNRSLWGSWLIEYNGYRIYFGGDTADWYHFEYIAQEFPSIDVALLPVGPCEPRKWMQHSHINAQEAGKAFLTLGAKHFIPMHWGTFHFGLDAVHTPIEQLYAWWNANQDTLKHAHLHVTPIGEKMYFDSLFKKSAQTKTSYQELT